MLVGTDKRERQKANRAKRREEELKAARATKVKRTALRWVLAAVLAVGAVVLIAWIGGAFDGDDEDAPVVSTIPITLPIEDTTAPASTAPVAATTAPATTAAP